MEQTGVALEDAAEEMVHVTQAKVTAIAIGNAPMASSVEKIIVTVTSTHGINGGAEGMIAVSVGNVLQMAGKFFIINLSSFIMKINLTVLTPLEYYHCETQLPIVYPRQGLDAMVLIGSTFEDAVDTMDPAIQEKEIVTRIANVPMA